MTVFVWLILGHLVADYALQTDFIAKFKSRKMSLASVPWYYVMLGHVGTHAAAVGFVTLSPFLALVELVCHFAIDVAKCEGTTTIHEDQALHVGCKALWAIFFAYGFC